MTEPRQLVGGVPRPWHGAWMRRRRFMAWWADAWVVGVVCLAQVGLLWTAGADLIAIIAPALFLAAFVTLKAEARLEHRRGFYRGVAVATRRMSQAGQGTTPNIAEHALAHGDRERVPEPWHELDPLVARGTAEGGAAS
ncbi:hypothetical protein ASE38_01575 [Cellulomonas sp. Root930]|nr:hypothetical protein ASE38_01575 [Cellulomonas sp. Root930]